MHIRRTVAATLAACLMALPAMAETIVIEDAYARAATPNAKAGAAFMQITNTGEVDDRLVSATSDISVRVELHTHIDAGDGVMKMVEVEEGFPIPAGSTYALQRGGDHVMFMGLNQSLIQGETVSVTLTFEQAGDVVLDLPVDNERMEPHGEGTMHGSDS